jgi:hypothetical protein
MLLRSTDTLQASQNYAFTYATGVLNFTTDEDVLVGLKAFMQAYSADVLSASRGFMSGHRVIVFVPSTNATLSLWMDVFANAWQSLGLSANLIQVEAGETSTSAGGASQVVTDTAAGIGSMTAGTIMAFIKPLAPVLIVAVAGLLTYEYLKHRHA